MDVSVLIISYNQQDFIAEAIESALEQTRPPEEIIIVDDASTDRTADIAGDYAAEYDEIEMVCHETEKGIPRTRNHALSLANGDVVTFLDGDDRYNPEKLEHEADLLRSSEASIVYSNFERIDGRGEHIDKWCTGTEPPTGDVFEECITRRFPGGILFRDWLAYRDSLTAVGEYDELLPIFEDWDMKIRLTGCYDVEYVDHVGSAYRRHSNGISSRTDYQLRADCWNTIYWKYKVRIDDRVVSEWRAWRMKERFRSLVFMAEAFSDVSQNRRWLGLRKYLQHLRYDPTSITDVTRHVAFAVEMVR